MCSHPAQTQQLGEDEKVEVVSRMSSCLITLDLSGCLRALKQILPSPRCLPEAVPCAIRQERFIQPSDSSKPPTAWWDVKRESY